ncbi:MAG: hypothetical protein K8R69_02895 [Deltaproteobacteria bacterium]|nr:hypothetical protein [Deltaproteobacteria bacterium]
MKKFLVIAALLLSVGALGSAARAQSAPNLAGTYWVSGTNPDGKGSYKGIATLVKSGDTYRIHWEVGTTYDGIGKLNDKTFTVEWGTATENVGTVTYILQPNGSLKGTWSVAKDPGHLGTETLTPKK